MLKAVLRFSLLVSLFLFTIPSALASEMAITIDDLPSAGTLPPHMTRLDITKQMLAVLKKHHINNAYGFINGIGTNNDGMEALQAWVNAGEPIGNHTYTHNNLAKISAQSYIADIQKNEALLEKLQPNNAQAYKYFRYPFHSEGDTVAKREAVRSYLLSHGYKIAPVTVDFADYYWNSPYVRCLRKNNQQGVASLEKSYMEQAINSLLIAQAMSQSLYGRDIKQVLLFHINAFSAKMLDQMLTTYEKRGVKFISLQDALTDKAYQSNNNLPRIAYTFLYQVQKSRHAKMPGVKGLYPMVAANQLNGICR